MSTPILISAYAASPAHTRWDPALEAQLLPALCELPDVVGLEVPWLGAIHPHDSSWFLRNVPAGVQLSVTALPWVMRRCAKMPSYGLASPDDAGRAAALADFRRLAVDVGRISEESSASVEFVGIHTAPPGGGSAQALARSIEELASWEWGGAQLIIEHCDAVVAGQAHEKGFLRIEEEIAVIDDTGAAVGLWMNWGRSAIELRNPDAVTSQIAGATQSGHLVGLTFSGAAAVDGPYGKAWSDTHLPIHSTHPESGSLLDGAAVEASLVAADSVPWYGVKVSRRPADTTANDVVRTVAANLDALTHRASTC